MRLGINKITKISKRESTCEINKNRTRHTGTLWSTHTAHSVFLLVCMQKGAPPPISDPLHTHGWQGNMVEKGYVTEHTSALWTACVVNTRRCANGAWPLYLGTQRELQKTSQCHCHADDSYENYAASPLQSAVRGPARARGAGPGFDFGAHPVAFSCL